MNGVWLIPSLNRIESLKKQCEALKRTETSTPGWILVDQGDYISKQAEYQALDLPKDWKIVQTNHVTMGGKVREVWDQIIDFDWIGLMGDDNFPETPNWDRKVISQINGHNILGTNDGWQAPQRLAGATCFSGKVLKTINWMFIPGTQHLYIDSAWEFLGGKAGCVQIVMDVMVRHDHAFVNGVKDETHHKVYPKDWQIPVEGNDTWYFQKWMKEEANKDLEKLVAIQPKAGLMIATPSHDGNCTLDYALGLTDLAIFMTAHGIYFEMARVVGSSLIPHARNSLVDMFMKSKCQKLLFVDSDQGFNKEAALLLFQSDRKIIAGVTPHKRFPINLNFDPLEEDKHYFKEPNNKSSQEFFKFVEEKADKTSGEIKVEKAGSGFICIDRSVFESMGSHVADYSPFDNNDAAPHKEYFKMGAIDGKFRGEDWAFCEIAKSLSIPMFINGRALVSHKGTYTFQVGQ